MGELAKKATIEEVWAATKATEEARLRGEEALRESRRKTEESQRKTEESLRQTQKAVRELSRNLDKANGNFKNEWGRFFENFFEEDSIKLLDGWGIKVERTLPRVKVNMAGRTLAEYDLLAVNGGKIVVVEVETTLGKYAVGRLIEKLKKFRNHLPVYKDKILYGAVAYMSIKEQKEDQSKKFPEYADASEMAHFLIQSPSGAKDVSTIVNEKGFKPKAF